jgi:hypothetical protein
LLLGRDHLLLLLLGGGGGCSSRSLTAFAASVLSLVGRSHRCMKRSQLAHHLLIEVGLVRVHSLRMLAQIVKTRELLSAVTAEWPFASVFPVNRSCIISNSVSDER